MVSAREQQIDAALRHLRRRDPVMKQLIRRIGPFRLKLQRDRFQTLVRSIVSQQISAAAARGILARLNQQLAPERLSPQSLLRLDADALRTSGISRQKANYLRDLAEKTAAGQVRLNRLGRMADELAIQELIQVKGIGRWTAQMLLIFSLGRLDVLPHDDLGIRAAIRDQYQLDELPDPPTCQRIAAPWRPYASVACWYCWRSRELRQND